MKLILISIVCLVVFSEVESKTGRLKVCIPKKKKHLNEVPTNITFEKTFENLSKLPEDFTIPWKIPLKFSNEVIKAVGYAKTITLSNFMNFTLCISPTHFEEPMNITLNTLKIQGEEYHIEGEVAELFDIYGTGAFEMEVEAFTFAVTNFGFKKPLFRCYGIDLNISLRKFKANLQHLMNGDRVLNPLFNKVIGDLGPDFIDFVWPPLYDFIEPYIQIFLDKFVNSRELTDFMELSMAGGIIKPKCYDFPSKK